MPDVQRLLALANGAALHKALRDAGYPAKYRTVARWVQTRQVPPDMEQAVLEAFGLGQAETPPPWWAEASRALLDRLDERMMPSVESGDPRALAVFARLVAELKREGLLGDEAGPAVSAEPRGVARRAAKRPR